jgi:signal transduction histidine kinase/HAMP domain-containing protein
MLRALDAESGQRLKMLKLSILSILAASILVTAMLWLMTTRYAKRALGQLGRAVSSIKKEEYDYDTGKLPQDEFGDLGLFLKEMSLQLSAHIERVRQGERFLQKIIDGIDESIMLVGKDYRVQLLNRKARETTGYSGTGGFTCYEVSHGSKEPCSGDEHPCPLLETVETGEAAIYQHVHRAGNGEKRYVEIVASPLRGEDGRIDAVIEASRDITALKEAEESLRKAKEDLELQNIELKKMDRIKDGLLRDVSHELKTPVAKFAMQLEILKPLMDQHRLSASEKKAITVMEESLRRQEGVIKNLLDLSRLEAGGRRFNISTVSLDELIDRVEEDYRHLVEQHSGKIRIDVAPLAIRSDAEMLWHVFSNLFNNAIKFRKKDGPLRISVSAEAEDGTVKIRVADEGEGFSGEEMSRAFDRFYQSTASKEGSGVGLTICKMIVEALGGSISIHSDGKGQGSVVSVTLPTG